MLLLIIAIAPVFILLTYIYIRDKYEKEPIGLLIWGVVLGGLTCIPILFLESFLSLYGFSHNYLSAFYNGFIVAGFSEELFKFLAIYIFLFGRKSFNERFDGIVYSVFVSLGFALVENIGYVYSYGLGTGILRAFTAVPAHTIFGIVMGFYMGLAKFTPGKKAKYLFIAFLSAWFLHGLYDFLLMTGNIIFVLLEIPFMIFMIRYSLKRIKKMQEITQLPEGDF